MKTSRKPLKKPKGMTYADVLAHARAQKAAVEARTVEAVANVQVQRMMWLMVCSMADAYGIGPKRAERFFECLQSNSDALQKMRDEVDDEYAWEKLRLKAQEVTGIDIRDIYEVYAKTEGV